MNNNTLSYLFIFLVINMLYTSSSCIRLQKESNGINTDTSDDYREHGDIMPNITTSDSPSNANVIQILGGSDFANATMPLNEVFTVLIEGYSENDGNWFLANKDSLADFITPIDIKDDGQSTKFIPDNYSNGDSKDTNSNNNETIGTCEFGFKTIKATTGLNEGIELKFELKHPWDPMPIRTIAVSITIE